MTGSFDGISPVIHKTCFLAPGSSVTGEVILNENCSVWYNAVLRGDMASILAGVNTNIQDGAVLHCTKGIELTIGKGVTVGHGAILHSCKVGDNTLIGMGAIILDNVTIGENCIIGAGALLTPGTAIPEGSLAIGSPAAVKRKLTVDEIESIRKNAVEYVEYAAKCKGL